MPVYVFESSTGDRVEELHPVSSIPDSVEIDGVSYRRIISGMFGHRYAVWSERPDQEENRMLAMRAIERPNPNCYNGKSLMESIKCGEAEPPPGAKWAPRTGRIY